MRALVVFIAALLLTGCDKIQGLIDTRASDAKAVGYSCRMANKLPNVCMAEHPKDPQSYVLAGWQKADEQIKAGEADPSMSNKVVSDEEEASDQETTKDKTEE
ncbi:MAG: hypothetical protein ACKVN9_06670 [Methylophilaceae bacterium]